MSSLYDWIEKASPDKTNHLPCRVCGSSDAMSIEPGEGDTGVVHCHSCLYGGTGAHYLRDGFGLTLHDALVEMGVESADEWAKRTGPEKRAARQLARQREHQMERRRYEELKIHSAQPPGKGYTLLEVERIKGLMTDEDRAHYDTLIEKAEANELKHPGNKITTYLAQIEAKRGPVEKGYCDPDTLEIKPAPPERPAAA